MSELSDEYAGRIEFTVIQTAGQEAESGVETYDVGNHGLVVFDADGNVVRTIPGHDFKKPEIEAICEELVSG